MKRCLPVAILILLLYSSAAYASSSPSGLSHPLPLLKIRAVFGPSGIRPPAQRDRPLTSTSAPTGQQETALRLPDSVFSPATLHSGFVGTEDAATADSNEFRNYHSTTYASLGMTGGYYERADWQPSGSSDTINFRYQGSIYESAAKAENAWTDGITSTQSKYNLTSQPCSGSLPASVNCQFVQDTADSTSFIYLAAQINTCLVETEAIGSQATMGANLTQVEQTLNAISNSAIATAQSACSGTLPPTTVPTLPPPTPLPTRPPTVIPTRPPTATPTPRTVRTVFTIVSVRVEKYGAKPDWSLVRPPLKQARVGTKLQISTYYSVHSAPAKAPITVHVTLHSGGQSASRTYHDKLAAHPVDSYREWIGWTPPAGTFVISVQISSGGVTHSGRVSFTVLRKTPTAPRKTPTPLPRKTPIAPHKTPTPLPAPSFSFDNLQTFGPQNRPQSTFKVGGPISWKASYAVKNLPAKAIARIIVTYQYPVNGGWRPYAPPDSFGLTASNGPNVYTNSLVIPRDYSYPSLRIVVGITIGSKTLSRTVTVHITH